MSNGPDVRAFALGSLTRPQTGLVSADDVKISKQSTENDEANNNTKDASEVEDSKDKRQNIIRVDKIWDKKTRKFRYVKTAKPKSQKEKFSRFVVTVARQISVQGVFTGEHEVDIRGQYLKDILTDIFKNAESVAIPSPVHLIQRELPLLYHAYPHLLRRLQSAKASENPESELIFELEALISFIVEHFASEMNQLSNLPDFKISFDLLWTLFPPNTVGIGQDGLGQDRLYRAKRCAYGERPDRSKYFAVAVDYLDSDGTETGWVKTEGLSVEQFEGIIALDKLPIYPFKRHPNHQTLRADLISRGESLLKLRGRRLQEYAGHALHEPKGDAAHARNEQRDRLEKFNSHGRVMLDPKTFRDVVPDNKIVPKIGSAIRDADLIDDLKMMLNPSLYGFSLGDKIWGSFAFSKISHVIWNETIINSLVLQENRKQFIQALVRTHGLRDEKDSFDDFVRDKGKGLIGLLSGPPGVGKTLTAEAVAEIAHRPLYMVSSGELGETSQSVQAQLTRLFELAKIWNAVVLIDEADVFLTKRGDQDLVRSAITSVFLRLLEYYQGILLLTTNRIASFDEAFQSRIQFFFEYKELDRGARMAIWQNFVDRARESKRLEVKLSELDIEELAGHTLNGRQIKNCMSISQAVCTEREEPLDMACVRMAITFAKSVWDVSGGESMAAAESRPIDEVSLI